MSSPPGDLFLFCYFREEGGGGLGMDHDVTERNGRMSRTWIIGTFERLEKDREKVERRMRR
jgi:hypothetical protein